MTHLCQVDSGFWELEIARPVHLVEVQGAGGVSVCICMCVMWEAREGVVWERGGGSGMARAKERHQS